MLYQDSEPLRLSSRLTIKFDRGWFIEPIMLRSGFHALK